VREPGVRDGRIPSSDRLAAVGSEDTTKNQAS